MNQSKKRWIVTIWQVGQIGESLLKELLGKARIKITEEHSEKDTEVIFYHIRTRPREFDPWRHIKGNRILVLVVDQSFENRIRARNYVQFIAEYVQKKDLYILVYDSEGVRNEDWENRLEQYAAEVYEKKQIAESKAREEVEKKQKVTIRLLEDSVKGFGFSMDEFIEFCSIPRSVEELVERFVIHEVLVKYICENLCQTNILTTNEMDWRTLQVYKPMEWETEIQEKKELADNITPISFREPKYVHKILILGDSNVGKRTVYLHFADYIMGSLMGSLISGIKVNLAIKHIDFGTESTKLVFWIIDAESPFREQYYNNSAGAIYVFDTTRPDTLESMNNWMKFFGLPVIMVENKTDLESAIPRTLVNSYIDKYDAQFIQAGFEAEGTSKKQEFESALLRLIGEVK